MTATNKTQPLAAGEAAKIAESVSAGIQLLARYAMEQSNAAAAWVSRDGEADGRMGHWGVHLYADAKKMHDGISSCGISCDFGIALAQSQRVFAQKLADSLEPALV